MIFIGNMMVPAIPVFAYTQAPKRYWNFYYDNSWIYPINDLMDTIGDEMDEFLELADERGTITLQLWGPQYSYTNLTYRRYTSPVEVTEWFDSFYGPLIYYLQHIPNYQRFSVPIAFSQIKFTSSETVYICKNVNDFADAKAAASLPSMKNGQYALLITDSYSEPALQAELERLEAKHLILLGGAGIYDTIEAIGNSYDVIRIGGKDRGETLWLAQNISSKVFNHTKPPYNQGTYTFIDNVGLSSSTTQTIKNYLARGDFISAAKVLTQTTHGSQSRVVNGNPAVVIGVDEKFLMTYYVYDGALVYQYFGPQYPEFPHPPIADFTVSPTLTALDVDNRITIIDRSYDPDDDPIVERQWQVKKDGGTWVDVSTPPTDLSYYGAGTHYIRLRVKDQPKSPKFEPLWSNWVEKSFTVLPANQKPIARFTVSPNPVAADEPVTYSESSYDPEGKQIVEKIWTIRCLETGEVYQYVNKTPPTIFEKTGWGKDRDGVGTYEITLQVKDTSPNGISPAKWSDPVTQILVVENPLRINGLAMIDLVNPPSETKLPVIYPVELPVKVKAGYRMTFKLNATGGDKVDIKLYSNGKPFKVHTDDISNTDTITIFTNRNSDFVTFSFWTDENVPVGVVLDMKIILTKIKSDGTQKSIVNNELGEHFAIIVGSAKKDASINLTR